MSKTVTTKRNRPLQRGGTWTTGQHLQDAQGHLVGTLVTDTPDTSWPNATLTVDLIPDRTERRREEHTGPMTDV